MDRDGQAKPVLGRLLSLMISEMLHIGIHEKIEWPEQ